MTYRAFLLFTMALLTSSALESGAQGRAGGGNVPEKRGDSSSAQGKSAPAAKPASESKATTGTVLGTVVDSLHGGTLAEASVTVVQLPRRSVMTSGSGAFKIDSLPPGSYTLEILHSTLDSLGIRVVSDTIHIGGGDVQAMNLAIPSSASLVGAVCPSLRTQLGPGAVVGRVIDAESGAPMVGAEVSVVWFETTVDNTTGVRTTPRVRKAIVGDNGSFRICGVPRDLHGTLQASLKDAKTGEVELMTTNENLVVRYLRLSRTDSLVAQDTSALKTLRTGDGVVSGVVTNRGGVPIGGARVVVNGSMSRGVTSDDGAFSLTGVPLGTQTLEVRQMGYLPEVVTVEVDRKGAVPVTVRLGTTNSDAERLSSVEVKAKATEDALKKTGFYKRKKRESGKFLTESDIDKIQPVTTSDILRRIPGLYVVGSGPSVTVVSSRGNSCVRYLVDRHGSASTQGMSIDEFVNPTDIMAIEFYQANAVPMDLQTGRVSGCALVVIWTKAQVRSDDNGDNGDDGDGNDGGR